MAFRERQQGFTMVEAMVALVVLVFGLLGALAMQSAAISNTKISADRSIAAIHTSSILSKMNSNQDYWQTIPVGFDIGIGADGTISDLGAGSDGADLEAAGVDCVVQACSPLETAAYNLKNWVLRGTSFGNDGGISNRLSAPVARVRRVGNDFPVMLEVTIRWNEKRSTAAAPMGNGFYVAGDTAANAQRAIDFTVRARP